MNKSKFFTGQPIFGQLLSLIPRHLVSKSALSYKADRYCKRFNTYEHLVTMLYAVYNNCSSLREVTTGMLAWEQRITHLGLNYFPRKSTISDANLRRDASVFEEIYFGLLKKYRAFLSDSRSENSSSSNLYIFDSSTITLFNEVFKGTGLPDRNGKQKGGVKVHTLIRSDQDVPCFISYSAATANDSRFLKQLQLPAGSVIVFDRGYNDYATYNRFTSEHITWVTRLRNRVIYTTGEALAVSQQETDAGIISDQLILLGNSHHTDSIKVQARLITYHHQQTHRIYQFITNNTQLTASTIANIYKKRWQIELLFKRLKQNYQLNYFLGDTQNAIKIQIWCTLIADLLLKVIKRNSRCKWAFSTLCCMIRLHLMTYIDLAAFLKSAEKTLLQKINQNKQQIQLKQLFPT